MQSCFSRNGHVLVIPTVFQFYSVYYKLTFDLNRGKTLILFEVIMSVLKQLSTDSVSKVILNVIG